MGSVIPAYVPDSVAHVRLIGGVETSTDFGSGFWTPCTSVDVDTLSAFAEAVSGAWAATILASMSHASQLRSVRVVSYVAGHEYSGEYVATLDGGDVGDPYTAQACYVIDWFEALTYRGGHPRTYVWGLPTSATNSDLQTIEDAYRSSLSENAADFLAAFNALVITGAELATLSCLHRVEGGVPLAPGYLSALASPTVSERIGTQRRRIGR